MSAVDERAARPAQSPPTGLIRGAARRFVHDLAGARDLAAAVPATAWLGLIVAVSALWQLAFTRGIAAPWVFGDELVYSEFAKSFAATGDFAVREVPSGGLGPLYPILVAPAWALFEHIPTAYAAAKAINALLFSLTAVPAYLLARRVLPAQFALVAAALTVAVPSAVYTGTIMTESAFYPAFVTAALCMVRALERPTAARQALALGTIGVAFLIRAQAVVLAPAFATMILLFVLLENRAAGEGARSVVRRLRAFWVTWASALVAGVGTVAVLGRSPSDLLGSYAWAVREVSLTELPHWFLLDLADVDLYVGVVPFAAFPIVVALAARRDASRALRAVATASVALIFWMTLVVAGFASQPAGGRIHERNLFYVTPLLLIAFMVWVDRGLPRPRRLALISAGVAATLPALLPFADLAKASRRLEVLPALLWWNDMLSVDSVHVAVAVFAVLVAVGFLLLPSRLRIAAPVFVFLFFYVVSVAARSQVTLAATTARAAGASVEADWIDRQVGPGSDVPVVWWQDVPRSEVWQERFFSKRRAIWESEFFNRSVGRVYYYGQRTGFNLPDTPVTLGHDGTLRADGGAAIRTRYVLALAPLRVRGLAVAGDPGTGLVLYDVGSGPVRVASPRGPLG